MLVFMLWGSIFLIIYVYFLYPTIVSLVAWVRGRPPEKGHITPNVSIIIAAYNEEAAIGQTIENKLNLDYPRDKMELIVVSDGSSDGTDQVVSKYADHGVILLRQEPRQGKTAALNFAVKRAAGEILVFSDANSIWDREALAELVSLFSDASVGYVTGHMVYGSQAGSLSGDGCSAYMKYENYLRRMEARIGSVVGVDGGIDGLRKSLYSQMKPDQLPDFVLPLRVIEQGYRVAYEPRAILREEALADSIDEYKMRVRVTLRALHGIADMKKLLNPFRYGLFAWQFFSHKVLRYMVFLFLVTAYFSNLLLMLNPHTSYRALWVIQNILYSMALLGYALDKKKVNPGLLYIPYYFSLLNAAAAHAFWKFIHNEKMVIWKPRHG